MGGLFRLISREVFSISTLLFLLAAFNNASGASQSPMGNVTHSIKSAVHGLPIDNVMGKAKSAFASVGRLGGSGGGLTSGHGPIFIDYSS